MNHKIYFHNRYTILKIFQYATFLSQTWPQSDLYFWSKPEVKYLKKSISHEPLKIFSQSLYHFKDL